LGISGNVYTIPLVGVIIEMVFSGVVKLVWDPLDAMFWQSTRGFRISPMQRMAASMQVPETSGWFSVQETITINAPLEHVWSVLMDIERYGEWNTFVPSMKSSFQVGALLTMQVQMRKNLQVKSVETITAIEPNRLLAWKTRSPEWFLRGERFQVLTAIDAETTQYWTREGFTGILAPLLKIMLGKDLQRGFQAVAQNLKARAEQLHPVSPSEKSN
jgi:hypothetical protein